MPSVQTVGRFHFHYISTILRLHDGRQRAGRVVVIGCVRVDACGRHNAGEIVAFEGNPAQFGECSAVVRSRDRAIQHVVGHIEDFDVDQRGQLRRQCATQLRSSHTARVSNTVKREDNTCLQQWMGDASGNCGESSGETRTRLSLRYS